MAHKRTNASGAALPRIVNDLKRIKGIGPTIEKHLHSAGIETFVQLAELTPEAIASLVPNVSEKRITNQNWVRQARKLAPEHEKQKSRGQKKTPSTQTIRQHYENFTLEFLLDENNNARRIRQMHIQSGDVATWAKWDANGVIDFLATHTGAELAHFLPATHDKAEKKPDSKTSVPTEDKIRLLEWTTSLTDTNQPVQSLPQDQKFDVKLSFDIANTSLSDKSQLDITGTLFAKKLGGGSRKILGEIQTIVPYSQIINLTVGETTLTQGLYRLEAFITLIPSETSPPAKDSIDASFQGGLIQIY
jgi:hypothetical protein